MCKCRVPLYTKKATQICNKFARDYNNKGCHFYNKIWCNFTKNYIKSALLTKTAVVFCGNKL